MAQKGVYRDPSIVTARPIVPGPIAEYTQPEALTTGSQINEASLGAAYKAAPLTSGSSLSKSQSGAPWPSIINGAVKFFNSWKPNQLRNISNHNVAGNWGSQTGKANFGWRGSEFGNWEGPNGGPQALYPGTVANARRPMWNTLIPIVYGLRVLNPTASGAFDNQKVPQSVVSQFTTPTQFTPTGTASLANRAVVLQ